MGASFFDERPSGRTSSELAPMGCSYSGIHWPGNSKPKL